MPGVRPTQRQLAPRVRCLPTHSLNSPCQAGNLPRIRSLIKQLIEPSSGARAVPEATRLLRYPALLEAQFSSLFQRRRQEPKFSVAQSSLANVWQSESAHRFISIAHRAAIDERRQRSQKRLLRVCADGNTRLCDEKKAPDPNGAGREIHDARGNPIVSGLGARPCATDLRPRPRRFRRRDGAG